jgi:The (Largely Gram-negative Bacterial) Hydrophobe/Amphiphile Efflux-1 (HAE1) Family
MARFFINRPVFAIVLSLIITLIGAISIFALPIEQYPNIAPPRVSVSTNYLGANAAVVESAIANAIEQKINGAEGMIDMRSVSDDSGNYSVNITFDLSRDPDMAAVDVQNRVAQANAALPSAVLSSGVITQKQSANTIMYFAMYSPNGTYDSLFMKNYGSINLVDALKRVDGVSTISEFGPEYSMRIWLKPDKMAQLKVTTSDIANAISTQNIQSPTGSIGQQPSVSEQEFQYSTSIDSQLSEPEDFRRIIIRALPDGSVIRVGDVADVEVEARSSSVAGSINGKEAAVFAVQLTPEANSLTAVTEIREVIESAQAQFPADLDLEIIVDNTTFIKESLASVFQTFFEALLLVLIVVFVFLQNWRATVIPMLAIPVSLIGTFAVFVLMGFSINTLTMFAMVLAIGLVVDDAIVVVEAVEHHIEENKLSPKEAAFRAMDEVSDPIVATAFVLAAVFVPVAFFGGTIGVLYEQFALTITISMFFSTIVALTLTPALCALVLRPHEERKESTGGLNRFFKWFNRNFNKLLESYSNTVRKALKRLALWLVFLVVIAGCAGGFLKMLPTAFVPEEDQGFFMMAVNLPDASSLNRTQDVLDRLVGDFKQMPGVENVFSVAGFDILGSSRKSSSGLIGVSLKPWSERKSSETQISSLIGRVMMISAKYPEAIIIPFNAPALPGASSTGSLSLVVMDQAGTSTVQEVEENIKKFLAAAQERPEVGRVYTSFSTSTPSYKYEIDRDKIAKLGVTYGDALQTLRVFSGGSEVNDYLKFGRTWKVVMQGAPEYRADISDLQFYYVRSSNGALVPLSNLVTYNEITGPTSLNRFNALRAVTINGGPAPGASTGDAMRALEDVASETLPMGYTYEWVDQSRDEASSGSRSIVVFGLAMVFSFLVLAALYESWTIPFSILLSVPTGILGASFFQTVRGLQNDVYMQIGLVMLIGLCAKNAILIVEYAKMNLETRGMNVFDATVAAARLRLRPILMTSFAFIVGCLPLAIAGGAGAGARVAMGTTVVGGMLFVTMLGIFIVPVLFVAIETLVERVTGSKNVTKIDE